MHGLALAMFLASSLRGIMIAPPATPSPSATAPKAAPYDAAQWADRISPWKNPLHHDLRYRPKESNDGLWAEPYKGNAPLLFITSKHLNGSPAACAGTRSDAEESDRHDTKADMRKEGSSPMPSLIRR